MNYLCLSYQHALLPLANRLRREGAEVEHVPWSKRYTKAWAGAFPTLYGEDRRNAEALAPLIEKAMDSGTVVLTDHAKWEDLFKGAPNLYGTTPHLGDPEAVRVGAWVKGGEVFAPHLLVADMGAWPGGFGPRVEGGMTLVALSGLPPALSETIPRRLLKDGLVQAHLRKVTVDGKVEVSGLQQGWHALHLHAFAAALGEQPLGAVLSGEEPTLGKRYTVVVPVTVPPWPIRCNVPSAVEKIEVPGPAAARVLWHDVTVKGEVAGLDGFVGVARGSGSTLWAAQREALMVADAISVPEKQVRRDVGGGVELVLAGLEGLVGVTF